ncbi:50S ribosomal protein L23 [Candidatus Micrarchaeota archaeon]|nr:50S ribosomal protein L23 [Candidatus Micrarchaeota archaeon]
MHILYALTTERSVAMIEKENKLVFIIRSQSTKPQVKEEVERVYKENVASVRTLTEPKGRKKAIVKFKKKGAASDVAAKLKLI